MSRVPRAERREYGAHASLDALDRLASVEFDLPRHITEEPVGFLLSMLGTVKPQCCDLHAWTPVDSVQCSDQAKWLWKPLAVRTTRGTGTTA
jgi:hypothetical protein